MWSHWWLHGTVVDSTKPDSENNFLVALDRSGNEYGLAYMDLVTGEFSGDDPHGF